MKTELLGPTAKYPCESKMKQYFTEMESNYW